MPALRALGFLYVTTLANSRYRAHSSAYADGLLVKTAINKCLPLGRRLFLSLRFYIIPMPGLPAGIAGASSLMFATTDSVVSSVDATLVAF